MRKKRRLAQNKDTLHDLGPDDLLSRFSDDILVSIISHLPIKDAVVTSQISRRWRYLWPQIVRLDFEDKERSNNLVDFAERNKYINWVNYIIRQHKSSNIEKFKICFDLDKNARGAIGKWIEFAISKDVQTLELDLRHKNGIISYGWRNYVFPNKIFDKKRGSSIKRQSSIISSRPYATLMEIKFLTTLILKCVDVNDEGVEKILSNCPVLEHLSIHGSCHMVKVKIHGKLALKNLEIRSCVGLESIEISDSNLVSFTLKNLPITIRLDNLQKLEKISIGEGYSWKKINRLFCEISCCIPYLKVLELDLYRPPVPPFPELLKLNQLILKVGAWDNDSVFVLISLVEACPNLRRFKIQLIWSIWVRPEMTNGEVRQVAKQPHEHLEVVEIGGYYGRTGDFELAMYFIENGVALKKLVIDPSDPSMKRSRLVANVIMENAARYHAYQQLKPRIPVGVELTSFHRTTQELYPDIDPSTLTPEIQGQLWERVVRGPKKDRMYGFNKVTDFMGLFGQARTSCSSSNALEVESLRAELEAERKLRALERAEEQRRREEEAERWQKYEEERLQQEAMRKQFEAFMAPLQNQNPPSLIRSFRIIDTYDVIM